MTRWMAWAVGCALALNGCASDDLGDVSVTVQALSASDVARVTVTVEGAGIAPPIVQDLVPVGAQWQGELGGIPAGTDRTFTVVAYDAMGVEVYRGVATGVEVQRNRTVTVAILLQQSTPPDRRRNDPPRIEVVQVIPGVLAPGETASVLVTATDPDPGDVLTYEWTATDGTFADPTLPATTWTAPMADGTFRLTITVRDAAGARRAVRVDVPVGAAFGRGSARIGVSMNTWPEIDRFAIDPGLVGAGETADLLITVSDADGDAVTTTFTNDCGATIVGTTFAAPASVPPEGVTCNVELRAADGRGGESFADATVFVGTEIAGNHGPVIDHSFQSRWVAGPGTVVDLDVSALDADGDPLTFTWTATSGTLGPQTDTATTSALQWTSAGARATIVARATDPSGAYTEAVFEVTAGWLIGAGTPGTDHMTSVATNGSRIVVAGQPGGALTVAGMPVSRTGEQFVLVHLVTRLRRGRTVGDAHLRGGYRWSEQRLRDRSVRRNARSRRSIGDFDRWRRRLRRRLHRQRHAAMGARPGLSRA